MSSAFKVPVSCCPSNIHDPSFPLTLSFSTISVPTVLPVLRSSNYADPSVGFMSLSSKRNVSPECTFRRSLRVRFHQNPSLARDIWSAWFHSCQFLKFLRRTAHPFLSFQLNFMCLLPNHLDKDLVLCICRLVVFLGVFWFQQ